MASHTWALSAERAVRRGILLRFRAGCSLRILLCEDADDARGDLVVDDGGVVLADDVDAEFLETVWTVYRPVTRACTYHYVIRFELKRLRLESFWT